MVGHPARGGTSWRGQTFKQVGEQIARPSAEEAASCGGSISPGRPEVVDDGQGGQLAGCQAVKTVPAQREHAISAFDAGAGALEQLGAFESDLVDSRAIADLETCQWVVNSFA